MNKNAIEANDWITKSCEEIWQENFKTVHFDRLQDYKDENLKGISLLNYACSLLTKAVELVNNRADKNFKPLVYLPLGFSKKIKKWEEKNWNNLGKSREPPSLYILAMQNIFDLYVEEYKCPVMIPFHSNFPIAAIFRCFRSPEDLWDFSSGIYLYRKGDF